MARRFWFYEKKRGDRRTGSRKVASLGEGLLFTGLLLIGGVGMAALADRVLIPEWRANRQYREAKCTVLGTRIGEGRNSDGHPTYRPEIHIQFHVEGKAYDTYAYDAAKWDTVRREEAEARVKEFHTGDSAERTFPCWYDPIDPNNAVMVRGYTGWLYMLMFIPGSLFAIGSVGLLYTIYHWDTSAERRSSLEHRARELDPFNLDPNQPLQCIPCDADARNSPGTQLAYRLPVSTTPGWTMFATLIAALVWNGIAIYFLVVAIGRHWHGDANWLLSTLALGFAIIGGMLGNYLVRGLLRATGVGTTRLEISHHPLYPGEAYQVLLSQEGRLQLQALHVVLACEEKATYHQGTDVRTEIRRVFSQPVFNVAAMDVDPSRPLSQLAELAIPSGAMHSFQSPHNEVTWKLSVRGKAAGWSDFEREFPIIVHPPRAAGET